jgi:cyclopropane-fatty-acyl-phospholipid synthase
MSIVVAATKAFEALPLPDAMSRLAIRALVTNGARTASTLSSDATEVFARAMQSRPIATDTAIANRQHYEVPADFFELVLGPQRKYSCCYFEHDTTTLAAAEERALEVTAQHANLSDGQHVLELGCGWGSLTLWMARHFPGARIVAVSNSAAQRVTIERNLQHLGVTNVKVITADMNNFDAREKFDRVVSVEMFEHMSNWQALLQRIRGWLTDEGRAFLHVFAHRTTPYAFDVTNKSDWIAQHFFTGGIMPSHGLIHQFPDLFNVEAEWRWSGKHYARTAEHWLENFDANRDQIRPVLEPVYGADCDLWIRRWRLFFLATAGLFAHDNGATWGISHYRLRPP